MSDVNAKLSTALADRYRIERRLGEGGMATVYLAEDLKHKRKVALKVLRPELAAVLGAERFVQEITTTAQLQHPHILPLFDSGSVDGFLYYVMPYIEGETLRDKLNRETQLGIEASGGIDPNWSADGQTVYFKDPDFRVLLAARLQLDPRLAVVRVDTLTVLETESFSWDVDPRSGRIVATLDEFDMTSARIVLNFFETLRRRG